MPALDAIVQKDSSIVSRKIADEVILVPIRRMAKDVESLYTLNKVGARIWELIDGVRRVGDIRDSIIAEFEVANGKAEEDLLIILQQFREIGAINDV